MRSTQIVLFLVLMNGAAVALVPMLPGDVTPATGGGDEIDDAARQADSSAISRLPGSELIAGFFRAAGIIEDIRNVVFYGPEMLRNIGAPGALVSLFEIGIVFIVSFDVIEALTGRRLS